MIYRDDLTAAIAAREAETKRADEAEARLAELKAKQPFHWWIGIPFGVIGTCIAVISVFARISEQQRALDIQHAEAPDAAAPAAAPRVVFSDDFTVGEPQRILSFEVPQGAMQFERHFRAGVPATPQLSTETQLEVMSLAFQLTNASQMAEVYHRQLEADVQGLKPSGVINDRAYDRAGAERYDKEVTTIKKRMKEIARRECGAENGGIAVQLVPGIPNRLQIRCANEEEKPFGL